MAALHIVIALLLDSFCVKIKTADKLEREECIWNCGN